MGTPSEDGEAMSAIQSASAQMSTDCSAAEPKWFAAYTATHHEKSVSRQLAERGVESFFPAYRTRRQWKKRAPETVELPLFPNYVFVRIARGERVAVLGTPGVFSVVGSGQKPLELPEREIEVLRDGLHERNVEPHQYLVVGERARVVSGVLQGLEGVILRKKNNLQIVLSLDQIMQSVAIEVDARELELVSRGPNCVNTDSLPVTSFHVAKRQDHSWLQSRS
jgi:transcription antitermination factor NusG